MLEFVLHELAASDEWRNVLAAYDHGDAQQKQANPEADGWLPRLRNVDGVETGRLSQLHGRLIALGYLKFELSGKTGMRYQLSPLGRQSLERGLPAGPEAEIAAAADAQPDE
jgi:hypothetical protein